MNSSTYHTLRRGFAASLFALVALGSLGSFQSASDLLPVSKEPLGSGATRAKYMAVVRERGQEPQADWSDMQSTIWQIQLGGNGPHAARRIALGPSHWTPTPIGGTPAVLRWQVPSPDGSRGYGVKILGVDFEDFTLKELLVTRQAFEIGHQGDRIYLRTSDGQRYLDRTTGELVPQDPEIKLLASAGDRWLVQANGKTCIFDPKTGTVTKTFSQIPSDSTPYSMGYVEWNGGPVAIKRGGFSDENGKSIEALNFNEQEIVYRKLHLWDLSRGAEHTVSVRMQATGGSGIGVIPTDLRVEITADGVRYSERLPLEGEHASLSEFDFERDTEWVDFDLATGKEVGRAPLGSSANLPSIPFENKEALRGPRFDPTSTVPAHLKELFAKSPIGVWGPEQDLAYAFLKYKGVDLVLQETNSDGNPVGVCKFDAVCTLSDWSELLVVHNGFFYDCNLKTQEVRKLPAPESFTGVNVSLYAIQ